MNRPIGRPRVLPARPFFSSGPCAKRPGWTPAILADAALGRSHRAQAGKTKLQELIARSRAILGIPADYRLGIVPASDTGAVEMALWSLLGPRPVTILAFESFGREWADDVTAELKLKAEIRTAAYGSLPDLNRIDPGDDIVFAWNGTTSGVCLPRNDWIAADRTGLTICDATSAVFAMNLPWEKLDTVTWSWQKVLGGEAGFGMLALSPRAAARLESHRPTWPMPKIFRLTKNGKLIEGIFRGETINTPSLLAVEDQLDALAWAEKLGGLAALIARAQANLDLVAEWVAQSGWADFLAGDKAIRSSTSVCLKIVDPWFRALAHERQADVAGEIAALLERENAAFDIGAYRDAPPGLRIWCGATVEASDIEALMPWLDWAFAEAKAALPKAA